MSKVLVDREDIEAVRNTLANGGQAVAVLRWAENILAQLAEAEGVEVVAYAYIDETPEDYLRTKPFVVFAGPDGGAPGPAMAHERLEALVRLSALQAVTAERDARYGKLVAATAELDQIRAAISDPEVVFVNMKRGTIAKPSLRSMIDLYGEVVNGEDAQLLEIAKLRAEVEALRTLAAECDEYLNTDRETSIGSRSILHRKLTDAAMAAKEA